MGLFALLMSLFRLLFFLYRPSNSEGSLEEYFSAFLLGIRLDLSSLGYIFAVAFLITFALVFIRSLSVKTVKRVLYIYFFLAFSLLAILLVSDLLFFSYFGERVNIMIFGVIDDDTAALWEIAKKNYNLFAAAVLAALYLFFLRYVLKRAILDARDAGISVGTKGFAAISFLFAAALFLIIRGGFGMFPIYHWTRDVAADRFLNQISKNGVYLFVEALKQYRKSKKDEIDFVKISGFEGKIEEAFKTVSQRGEDFGDLWRYIERKSPQKAPFEGSNVVLVMVESFGMPLLKYQSEQFDILGSLKHHFKEDILFENFISTSNGTIASMEPTLLNIISRPSTLPYGQSVYQNVSFVQAAAKVFKRAGYKTIFLYGGDLSWRNVGNFFSKQGFDYVWGKSKILKELSLEPEKSVHDWGVFDEYLYSFILKTLSEAKEPLFIFAMTTNNHPPYTVPEHFKKEPEIPPSLQKRIRGDAKLFRKRIKDYAYALDAAGDFLDRIKSSDLFRNTLVAITADNNTIEGMMSYEDYIKESKKIPFYIFLPGGAKLSYDSMTPGSHEDIMPTLYNLTLSGVRYYAIGEDMFDPDLLHCGFNDKGIGVAPDGSFLLKEPKTGLQKRCAKLYKASLAVTDFIVKSQLKKGVGEKE